VHVKPDQTWTPRHIEIEPTFASFVPTFRGGQFVSELIPKSGKMPLNADYFFPADNVIAELKCFEKNPTEASDWPDRMMRAFEAAGRSFEDAASVVPGAPVPDEVGANLFNWLRDAIRGTVKAGNRQIRETKRALGGPDARGVLLIANDHHYGFAPAMMVDIISDAVATLRDNHVDALVYFTPNVFHRIENSDVAWIFWETRYVEDANGSIQEFVNALGRKWADYQQAVTGDPYVARQELDIAQAETFVAGARPVRRLGRARR
jgi:hypothetical protein